MTTPTEALKMARDALAWLHSMAEGGKAVDHLYDGDCPDQLDRTRRDPACPACKAMDRAAAVIAVIDALPQPSAPSAEPAEPAPHHGLPSWDECALRVANSDFIAKRVAAGGYGAEPDTKLADNLHRFIYEYDDSDPYRSAWFMHRLELALKDHGAAPQQTTPQAAKAAAVHALVNAGPFPGMNEAFSAHMGAECWTDPAYAPDAAMWAAAWKAAWRATTPAPQQTAPQTAPQAGKCLSSAPDGMRPDFRCPDMTCGFLGQCRLAPVRGALYATPPAAPVPTVQPLTVDYLLVQAIADDLGMSYNELSRAIRHYFRDASAPAPIPEAP